MKILSVKSTTIKLPEYNGLRGDMCAQIVSVPTGLLIAKAFKMINETCMSSHY